MSSDTRAISYLTRPLLTIGQNDTLEVAIDLMIEHQINCLPVVDKSGRLEGILTEGDILRRTATSAPARPMHWLSFLLGTGPTQRHVDRKVRDVMTRNAIAVSASATPESVIDQMRIHRIQQVPVLEQGQLLGMIDRTALMDAFAEVAVSVADCAADRSLARDRWARLDAMQTSTNGIASIKVRDDVVNLFSTINRSADLQHDQRQFS